MKKYNRVMLGRGGKYAKTCRENGYIGGHSRQINDRCRAGMRFPLDYRERA